MKTGKRILALVLAFMMVFSVLMSNLATNVQADDGTQTATEAESSSSDKETNSNIVTSDSTSEEDEDSLYYDRDAEDAEAADTDGVENGEDALDADLAAVDGSLESGVSVEQVDRDEIDTDLTKDGSNDAAIESLYDDDDVVKVIIEFEGDSVIEGNADAEVGSAYANTKISMLEKVQESAVAEIEEEVLDGEELDITYSYTWIMNGIATEVAYGDIAAIEALDSVEKVYIQEMYYAAETSDTDSEEIYTITSGGMIGKTDTWDLGYTGEGVKITIIDTGLDIDHPNFSALSEDKLVEGVSADEDTIADVLTELNAYSRYYEATGDTLTVDDVYYSTKVVYGFNYVDYSTDITHENDSQGDHGTHVAGIAASNVSEEVTGVAPDAQLYIMKVFGYYGGAYDEDMMAAIEDALLLGTDVINMSIGSTAGFTVSGDTALDAVYARVGETNVIMAISAGNSYTFGYGNLQGYEANSTENPDNGVVSSPGTYVNAISVASVENSYITSYYLEVAGEKITYNEGSSGDNAAMSTLYGQTLEFVVVGGVGEEADYEGLDVEGKVALVQRGSINFTAKLENAEAAGAIAIIVYNNVENETFSADLSDTTGTIPFVSITLEDAEIMIAAAEAGDTSVYISDDTATVLNPAGYEMNTFSSWGTTGDLKIEPDVTAPGGDIYSTLNDGTYGLMSGTSMASPQIAGISAVMQQYIREEYPLWSDDQVQDVITALLLSTATPLSYDSDTYYSVRQQGSGLANALYAVTSKAYLSVAGQTEPQAELGDDPDRTGVYEYTFDVVNFGEENLYFEDIATTVQTEDVVEYDGKEYMSSTPLNLDATTSAEGTAFILTYDYDEDEDTDSHDAWTAYTTLADISDNDQFRYDLTENDALEAADVQAYLDALVGNNADVDLTATVIGVKAGESASITVTVTVSDEGKAWMDEHYVNGIYVEGFTVLTAMEGGVDLSIPYLAFYGDWTDADMIDGGYYYMSEEELAEKATQYYNFLWSNYAGYDDYWYPGLNPYVDEDEIDQRHISISPNGDGYDDYISDIYVSLLRNAELLTITFSDEETGEVYVENAAENISKSYYYSGYGVCLPFLYSWYFDTWDVTDNEGVTLANNTKIHMSIAAYLDAEDESSADYWEQTIIVDTEAPVLDEESMEITVAEDGSQTLTITISDNVDIAGVNFLTKGGGILAQYAVEDPEVQGDSVTVSYDITGYGNSFYLILGDYALNESAYIITTTDNLPVLDTDLLYGFRVGDQYIYDDTLFGWVSMNTESGDDFATTVLDSEYYIDYAITAAAYADGVIFAVAADNQLYAITTPGLWDEWTWIADVGVSIRTMTYDPTTGYLYGYSSAAYGLYQINPITGETTRISTSYMTTIVTALACDDDGQLYGITTGGYMRMINKETGAWDQTVLNYNLSTEFKAQTGLGYTSFSYAQSMVYDSADDCFYWAAFSYNSYYGTFGGLVKIVLGTDEDGAYTVEETVLGEIEGSAEICGLLKLEDRGGLEIPEVDEITALDIEEESVSLLVGGTADLTTIFTPWYASDIDLVWTSADDSVAMVDVTGTVTATGVGETIITATNPATGLSDTCTIIVVDPQSVLNGYIITDNYYYQWATFFAGDLDAYIVWTEEGFTDISAAEYYDGYIYAYDAVGSFYRIDELDYTMEKIGELDVDATIIDMAFDYSTGYMYALTQDAYLFIVDLMTGHVDTLDYYTWLTDDYYGSPVGLAVSTDGTIYYVTDTSFLCTYDLETYTYTQIGLTGVSAYTYLQSMTYDHDTDELYWAALDGLYYMDMSTGSALNLGLLDATSISEIIGLYAVPSEENLPELDYVAVESADVTSDSVTLLAGMTTTAPVDIRPYNATDRTITWTIEDESIASIDGTQITGLKAGTTTATGTVENGAYSFELTINVLESAGALNAYILYDQSTANGYFWGTFNDYDLSSGEALATPQEYTVYAGEYYDGMIYAYGMNEDTWDYEVMVIDAETFEVVTSYVDGVDYDYPAFFEMAFDYSTGTLYAVGQAGGVNSSANSYLYMIDITTGACYTVGQASANLYTLACSEEGLLYAIDTNGDLYTVDKATAALTYVGSTGYPANQYQSMAFDYDTGNLYWAQCGYDSWSWAYTMEFLIVNTEDASVTKLGTLGAAGCQAVALYSVPDKEMTLGTYEATGVLFDSSSVSMSVGETSQLSATLTPVSVQATAADFAWASSDETVATVDANGLVTAVGAGVATITATAETANGTVSGTCKVTVLSETAAIYAMFSSGFDIFTVYDPTDWQNGVYYYEYEELADVYMEFSAYSSETETFYSLDYDGYLWSYQYSEEGGITNITKSENTMLSSLTDLDGAWTADLTVNTFNGKLYALVASQIEYEDWEGYYYNQYSIVEIDTATAEATEVSLVSENVGNPAGFAFTAEDYFVVYDTYTDYIYGQYLSMDASAAVEELAWVQSTLYCYSSVVAMYYSEMLDSVFIYAYNGNTWAYELFEFSMETYTLSSIGETWYDSGTFDVIFVE